MVKIVSYDETYREALMAVELEDDDRQFTGLPHEILDLSINDENRHPVVMLYGKRAVGLFILHKGNEIRQFYDDDHAILLRALSLDKKYHRRGIAYESMKLLNDYVKRHFQDIDKIVLAVNNKNIKAMNLYIKCNFEDRGITRQGAYGEQKILIKSIK